MIYLPKIGSYRYRVKLKGSEISLAEIPPFQGDPLTDHLQRLAKLTGLGEWRLRKQTYLQQLKEQLRTNAEAQKNFSVYDDFVHRLVRHVCYSQATLYTVRVYQVDALGQEVLVGETTQEQRASTARCVAMEIMNKVRPNPNWPAGPALTSPQ